MTWRQIARRYQRTKGRLRTAKSERTRQRILAELIGWAARSWRPH